MKKRSSPHIPGKGVRLRGGLSSLLLDGFFRGIIGEASKNEALFVGDKLMFSLIVDDGGAITISPFLGIKLGKVVNP